MKVLIRLVPLCLILALGLTAPAETPKAPVDAALANPLATGLLVMVVVPGSQAETSSVRPGDILTHYHGAAVKSLPELAGVKASAEGAESVEVVFVRQGARLVLAFGPGQLGLHLMPVTKGVAVEPLPAATDVSLDFSSLSGAPRDEWLVFTLDGKTPAGFEHHMLRLEGGKLHLRREVAFDGGDWGLNHFDASVVSTADGVPETLETTFMSPLTKAEWKGELEVHEDGGREWRIEWTRGEESGESGARAPTRLVSEYLIESIAAFMPREKGACLHFIPLGETTGPGNRAIALLVAGEEEFVHDGRTVKVWRVQRVHIGGQIAGAFRVDGRGRVIFSDYGGAQATLTTREKALGGLHEKLVPRSAK